MATAAEVRVELKQDKETRNKIRYGTDEEVAIDSLYVRKDEAEKLGPKVKVTVTKA